MSKYIRVSIDNDCDIQNPSQGAGFYDCTWTPISFSRKHSNYEDPSKYLRIIGKSNGYGVYVKPASIALRSKLRAGTAFLLDYYEHGAGKWSIHGSGPQCQWDTAQYAGILLWQNKPKDMGAKTHAERALDAINFLEIYNDWCNGYGHGYTIDLIEETEDSIDLTGLDSCWGFYDSDIAHTINEIIASLNTLTKQYPGLPVVAGDKSPDVLVEAIKGVNLARRA